ncbi:MAG TPA: ABC transporter ATP-binding protein, partial [Gemmataceae bacterium]|nr:ABC transporter ATP-binding protein [Gemmataceae bacterium]
SNSSSGPAMPTFVAEFADVSKTYRRPLRPGREVCALRGVTFGVERGEVFGVLGPNRAGKTTLVKILLGLCRPSGGQVVRLGRPLSDRATLARVGYVHEHQAFPRYLTAAELLEFYGDMTWVPSAVLRDRAAALLERVGLADRAGEPIARFSKGMVQRLALAQALLAEPELLVLDEPLEGLDLDGRRLLREVIAERRRAGCAVVLVSHALEEVAQVCDRVAVLVAGRLAHHGAVAPLLLDPLTGADRTLEAALAPIYRPEPQGSAA